MERVIKFRVWDVRESEWLKEQDCYIAVSNQARWKSEENKYYKVCQFTGLLDKNGAEIYEGDILKTPVAALKDVFNYSFVEYRDSIASYIKRNNGNTGYVRLEIRVNETEVIGNVHQNPSLLTSTPHP